MVLKILEKHEQYVLNLCTKYLARDNSEPRHNFGQFSDEDLRSRICESWRFPIIDSYSDGIDFEASYAFNKVTFVYLHQSSTLPKEVSVIGTFANLYEPIPLQPVEFQGEKTGYYALTVVVPKGEFHTYKFIVDGEPILDPINPQRAMLDNSKTWSRFFTQLCSEPLSFESWGFLILDRLVDHILPFRTAEGKNFLERFYFALEKQDKTNQYPHAYRLEESVGVVNFIDKLLAKEEHHNLIDYKICLDLIDRILRQRNPYIEPRFMPREMYVELYEQMAANNVPQWDYNQYNNPRYFLQLLRRHTFTGAFSHPKWGGNAGAVCWAYLSEKYRDESTGETLFNWRKGIEKPWGINVDYLG